MVVNGTKHLPPKGPKTSALRQALPQILAASVKNVLLLGFGMTLGYPTILIPSFLSGDPSEGSFSLSSEQISWIGSVNLICVPVGCLMSGAVTQTIGRKRAMQLNNIPFLTAWLLFNYSTEVWHVFLALCITGLNGGLLEAPVLTYVAEITQPRLRGILSSTSTLSVITGVLMQFLLGTFLHWRTVALANCSVPIVSFLLLFFVPESPHWLVMKNRLSEARESIAWLRGWTTVEDVDEEFEELRRHLSQDEKRAASKIDKMKLFAKRTFLYPYALVSFVFFLGHFSGMQTLQTYAVQIFATLRAPIDKYYATIFLGVAELAGCVFCVTLIHFTGKRWLNFFSLVTCGVCFLVTATYAYLIGATELATNQIAQTTDGDRSGYNWIPLTFLIAYAFLAHVGIRILPWILTGEVYTSETRAAASGLSSAISYVFGFLASKVFFSMISTLTLPGTFWFYSCVNFSGAVVLYFWLPETEGKSLHEIMEHFSGAKRLDNKVSRGKRTVGWVVNEGFSCSEENIKSEGNTESRL